MVVPAALFALCCVVMELLFLPAGVAALRRRATRE
jgi:hypothetical protein